MSLGIETCLHEHTHDPEVVRTTLLKLAEAVAGRLRKHEVRGKTITLKFRDADFVTETRARTLREPTEDAKEIFDVVLELMGRVRGKGKKIRLLGISLSKLEKPGGPGQLALFGRSEPSARVSKLDRLHKAQDSLSERFGKGSVKRASLLDSEPLDR
jgi:DNA polymerase-4